MNRAQRRAGITTNYYTEAQVRQLLVSDRQKLLKKFANDYSAVVALCLRDKLRFGKKRSMRFMEKVDILFQDLANGVITIDDIKQVLVDEVKIYID
jgi:hypothetical protein